jgi:hypothetical protein
MFGRNSNQRSLKIQLLGIGLALCLTAAGGADVALSAIQLEILIFTQNSVHGTRNSFIFKILPPSHCSP